MNRIRDIGLKIFFGFLLAFLIFHYDDTTVKASTITPGSYYFMFNNTKYTQNGEAELKTADTTLFISSDSPIHNDTTVLWESSEPGVITLEEIVGSSSVKVVRKGPGYSTIKATITSGNYSTIISFVVKVKLEINNASTGTVQETTTSKTGVLVFDSVTAAKKQIYLKFVDYTDGTGSVSGSAISASAVNFSSSNVGVATVDEEGYVTPVGGGSTTITVTSDTMSSSDKTMTDTLTVVVAPAFSLTFADSSGTSTTYNSINPKTQSGGIVSNVPSNFTLASNSTLGTDIKWVVKDCSKTTNNTISEGTSSKMTYKVSDISGNVTFTNVKAGTYEIFGFAKSTYTEGTNAPYAYMKLIVPINLGDTNIVMNVGDTYDVLNNSNLPGVGVFSTATYTDNNMNIATIDMSNYVIKAKKKGKVDITLTYNGGSNLFDISPTDKTIHITVIDGIALNITSASIYIGGTLQLLPITTDSSEVTWTSADTNIATVIGGVVTGKKDGTVKITAKQTVDGVVKTATCIITVQKTVTKIEVDPDKVILAIDSYKTLHATITPNLTGVTLQWKSSNTDVVQIEEYSALTATIKAVGGGTAVISAINQDNVVVGYTHVTVRQPVASIVLSETEATVSLAMKKLQIRASVYPETAMDKSVKWTSANTNIATVDQNGMVTFKTYGSVSIIATSIDNPSVTAICNLNIQVPVASVALDEKTKTMYVGQSARLTYTLLPTTASINSVTWTSTNTSVATVDGTGLVTAKGVGTTVIILKTIDGGHSVYCTITVRQVATAVKFDVATLNLKVGEYYNIKTTFTPNNSTDNGLVWESSDTKIATVDDSGKVIGKGAGSAIIMARTEAGGVAYCKVTVTQPATGLILNFSEKTIFIGTKFTLEASVSPSTATNLNVTWKSSNEKIATVSKNGEVSGLQGGVVIITATTAEGGYIATCVVTVRESVTTIKLDYETYYLGVGKNFKLTATVTTETATNQNVVWTSSNEDVATVNQKGKVTGIKNGYATITATALDGSDVEATCEVRVVNAVESITISDNYVSMYVGDTEKLKVTIRPSNATFKTATWSSSDTSVAIVDDRGVITALKAGTATITAEAQDNSGKKVICAVAVYDRVPATSITLQDKSLTMVAGEEKVVQIVLNPTTSTDSYTWSTDNPAVATVNKTTGRITARSTGKAYITVMTDSGKTASIEVTVIGLNMTSLTLEQYTTYPYRLEVEGATSAVKWSIDKPQVAVVSNGYVSSRAKGTATITAIVNGRKLTCKLKVTSIS
jgi:uncharacterized protein YjdB